MARRLDCFGYFHVHYLPILPCSSLLENNPNFAENTGPARHSARQRYAKVLVQMVSMSRSLSLKVLRISGAQSDPFNFRCPMTVFQRMAAAALVGQKAEGVVPEVQSKNELNMRSPDVGNGSQGFTEWGGKDILVRMHSFMPGYDWTPRCENPLEISELCTCDAASLQSRSFPTGSKSLIHLHWVGRFKFFCGRSLFRWLLQKLRCCANALAISISGMWQTLVPFVLAQQWEHVPWRFRCLAVQN